MGKSTISMVIFNSYVSLPEGTYMCDQTPVDIGVWGAIMAVTTSLECEKFPWNLWLSEANMFSSINHRKDRTVKSSRKKWWTIIILGAILWEGSSKPKNKIRTWYRQFRTCAMGQHVNISETTRLPAAPCYRSDQLNFCNAHWSSWSNTKVWE